MELGQLFDHLWRQYTTESPEALEIYNLFIANGEDIINDHIAFRTFNDKRVNVQSLGKIFKAMGYVSRGEYEFPVKKLYARHFEHERDPFKPKIFISELKTEEFSPELQQIAAQCIDRIPVALLGTPELLFAGNLWQKPEYKIYQKMLAESEYAAWFYVFGFRANHFTVLVNYLKKYTKIELVNKFLEEHGFVLNSSGGKIKGTPQELLEQSSTMANRVLVSFVEGDYEVLNSYYEFARRYPKENGKLYQGFVATSADKIFESTSDVKSL